MALPRAKLGVSLFRHPCRKPLSPGKAVYAWLALRPAKPIGIHARHPCRGYITGATAPRPSKDACSQPHKATMQGRIMTAAQSRCTMQRHKWLTTCTGATPQSKDALVACQKFCTMQNQQSKQHSTHHFYQQ